MDYHHVYVNEFLDKLKLKNSNDDIGVSANDWMNGSFFWIVDLNVDKCCNFHERGKEILELSRTRNDQK